MNIIRITSFSEKVFEAVHKLLPQLSGSAELPTRDYFKELLNSSNIHFFIMEDDEAIAGMLTIATYLIPTGLKVWIEDVVVDESQRGKGLGEELIKFAIEYSKSFNAKSVRLTSRSTRIAANQLYIKKGFARYETNVYEYVIEH